MTSPPQFILTPASWRDLFPLHNLERACFEDDSWPLIELLAVLTFPGMVRLKAVVTQKMVGFIAGERRHDEQTGWILTLGVFPAYRRLGIAAALLDRCEQELRMPKIKLSVRRSNLAAIDLYNKNGYTQIGVWSNYYHNGEDGLVLEKKLKISE